MPEPPAENFEISIENPADDIDNGPPSRTDLFKAKALQIGANLLCAIRPFQAADIANDVIQKENYQTWRTAGKFAVAVAFDIIDGVWARKAAELRKGETTSTGAKLDELSDKSLTHIVLGAIATRAGMDGDNKYQKFVLDNQTTIAGRDVRVTRKRKEARALSIDVKAQKTGKQKTRWQNAAIFTMLSPMMKNRLGRFVARKIQKRATKLALKSEEIYMQDFDDGIAKARQAVDLA